MNKRPMTVVCAVGLVLTLTAACGQARAGNAVPKGDDAAAYVGAKFETAMNKLQDIIGEQRNVTTSADKYFKFDERYAHSVITSSREGSPEDRVVHTRSRKDADLFLDVYTPADGTVEYLYLGPAYKALAPTAWVSYPKTEAGLAVPCTWGGVLTACKMADAVAISYNANKKTLKGAKSLPEGKMELAADVTFDSFLTRPVEALPQSMLDGITPEMRKALIPTTILLNADGSLDRLTMDAKFEGTGHKIELRYDFKVTGAATTRDMPAVPDAAQVSALPDKAAKDALYAKIAEVRGGK